MTGFPHVSAPWTDLPSHRDWLAAECDRLLAFGRAVAVPGGGAAWLDDDGRPDPSRGVLTWITCRMTHVYGLAALLGRPGATRIVDAGLAGLRGCLRDDVYGGWVEGLDATGRPTGDGAKTCYAHAFVVLAASTATVAGRPGARELLDEALAVFSTRFWDEAAGRNVDAWNREFTRLDPYRGVNGNMHSVEALLAAADVTGNRLWLERAARICAAVVGAAGANGWRVPEHYDAGWVADLELNADRPDDPFKPYGATVGHGLEWARLLLDVEAGQALAAGRAAPGPDAPASDLSTAAAELFGRAVADGWSVDGAPGFVYTTDWSGRPVVRDRMHWAVAEAVGAAAALHARTGDERYARRYAEWWDYAADHVIDHERGSWFHQLDPENRPVATVWPGKADLYHAVQATLLPRLPLAPTPATALARGLLRR